MGNSISLFRSHRAQQGKVLLECAIVYFFITRKTATEHLPLLQRLNAWIASQNLQPWQVVLASWLSVHVYSNFSLLMGLNAPHSSLYMEPDVHYTNSFSRIRWLLTALDAGFLSTMKVRIPVLREVLAILLSIYYLIFTRKGEVKVDSFRRAQTIQAIRRTWQKGQHPLFRFISWCTTPRIAVPGNIIGIPRADGTSSISCHFFFNGTSEELKKSRKLIIHFPGGGFVAMNPFHHKDYLTQYALRLKVPVVSVDYRKAPEYPYPSGFDDAFTVYQTLVQSNGRIIGIESAEPLRIAVTGDSAGGNLSATVTMRAINEGIQVPHGVHMIYPSLDFAGGMWRDQSGPKELVAKTPAQVNSRAQYAFDGVLPIKYMLTLGEAYLRSGGDPVNDYYISPARAPAELLAKFPPTYVHVGAVDPLLDDSVGFLRRIHEANPLIPTHIRIWPGVSHAYMHVISFLPVARQALQLSIQWLGDILEVPVEHPVAEDDMVELVEPRKRKAKL